MTTPARFVRGSNKLDLDNLIYYLGEDFTPPAPAREYNFASGTSLNRTGGASLVGTRAMNRPLEFTVNVRGTNEAANIAAARRLISFIMAGGDLFFEWQEYPNLPEPLWGQFGSWLRYEVVTATAQLNSLFGSMGRTANVRVEVSLQVKPYATGNKQRLINAAGYVFENNYGSVTGEAFGLSVHEATTNKMTNPVFGHATFGNGWTAGAGVIATKNTDNAFFLPGILQSAKITAPATQVYYQTIAAGNTNKHSFSAYVYLPDGGVPTTADFDIYYGISAQATTYASLGNGLYLAYSDNVDGISAATATGIIVKAGRTVYLCGYQMEEKAYHTPLAYGDLLGCAWTSTAHASTSTRTATNINVTRTDDFIHLEEGAVSFVWKPYNASTFAEIQALFVLNKSDYTANGLFAYYNQADDKLYFTDATNTISTAAQTFSAGTVLYLTFTWGPGGLNIYKSGANAATGATYTPATVANQAVFAIGQSNAGIIANGDILGFDVYPTEITAAQALALYTAQAALVAGGKRVSTIPWLWTKDGDGVVDNYYDATHNMHSVIGGVPGSDKSVTNIGLTTEENDTNFAVYQSLYTTEKSIDVSSFFYDSNSSADAGSLNGAYKATITTGGTTASWSLTPTWKNFIGGKINILLRMRDAGSNLSITNSIKLGLSDFWTGAKTASNVSSSYGIKVFQGPSIPYTPETSNLLLTTNFIRSTGSADVYVDYEAFMPGEICAFRSIGYGYNIFDYLSTRQSVYLYTSTLISQIAGFDGATLEFEPSKYNYLFSHVGWYDLSVLTRTVTYNYIYITPRWSLL